MSAYEWLIGTRHLRSTHRRGFVSFVALMSACGLMLGVATLIVVLSVMNGFERELRTRILAVTSHATLMELKASRLKEALALVDVRVLDHLIVAESIFSFSESGLL
jgi:ABC-type lipoprotein release transport system permease subunit